MSDDSKDSTNRSVTITDSHVGIIATGDNNRIQVKELNMGAMPADAGADDKARLAELLNQLNGLLKQTPPEKQAEAEAVAVYTDKLIEDARAEKPNKPMLKITANGMKEAAKAIAGVVPAAVKVVKEIADLVTGMVS